MKLFTLAGLASVLLAAGCMTTRETAVFNGVNVDGARRPAETLEVKNTGWFVFSCLPIITGNPDKPDRNSCRWFHDTVNLDNNMRVLTARMQEKGLKEAANISSHCDEEKYLLCLIVHRAYHTSAVLLKPLTVERPVSAKADRSDTVEQPVSAKADRSDTVERPVSAKADRSNKEAGNKK